MGERIVHLAQVTLGALMLARKDLLDEMTFWWTQHARPIWRATAEPLSNGLPAPARRSSCAIRFP